MSPPKRSGSHQGAGPPSDGALAASAPSQAEEKTHKSEEETRWERISGNLKTIGGAVLLALVIRTVLFEAFEIEGPSMEPTLLNGDRVVVAKFYYGLFLPFQREASFTWGMPDLGDIVIIKSPADNVDIVKRVIGLPGDVLAIRNNSVYRNGKRMPARDIGPCNVGRGRRRAPRCRIVETEIDGRTFQTSGVPMTQMRPAVLVREGHLYVLGDHRDSSNDSRNIGMIPFERVKGKALAIYWSRGEDGFRWHRIFRAVH